MTDIVEFANMSSPLNSLASLLAWPLSSLVDLANSGSLVEEQGSYSLTLMSLNFDSDLDKACMFFLAAVANASKRISIIYCLYWLGALIHE